MTLTEHDVRQGMFVLLGTFRAPRDLSGDALLPIARAWTAALQTTGITPQEWHTAVGRYLLEGRGWPDGLRPLLALVPRLALAQVDWSAEAWGYVLGLVQPMHATAMAELAARGEPLSPCPVMERALRSGLQACGGFRAIGRADAYQLGHTRRAFVDGFRACMARERACGARLGCNPLPELRVVKPALMVCAAQLKPTLPALQAIGGSTSQRAPAIVSR